MVPDDAVSDIRVIDLELEKNGHPVHFMDEENEIKAE